MLRRVTRLAAAFVLLVLGGVAMATPAAAAPRTVCAASGGTFPTATYSTLAQTLTLDKSISLTSLTFIPYAAQTYTLTVNGTQVATATATNSSAPTTFTLATPLNLAPGSHTLAIAQPTATRAYRSSAAPTVTCETGVVLGPFAANAAVHLPWALGIDEVTAPPPPPQGQGWPSPGLDWFAPGGSDTTGWSLPPFHDLPSGTSDARASVELSEPYWVPGQGVGMAWRGRHTAGSIGIRMQIFLSCDTPGDGGYVEESVFSYSNSRATGSLAGQITGVLNPDGTAAYLCEVGVPVGVVVILESTDATDALVERARNVWMYDIEHTVGGPTVSYCRSIFGPNYTPETTAEVAGATVTAASLGCAEDTLTDPDLDPNTDFETVCADAPQAEWLSFAWLDDWVGHYADCLFIPRGGLDIADVKAAFDDSFVADTGAMLDGFSNVEVQGSCGVLYSAAIATFGGRTISLDTCAAPWSSMGAIRGILGVGTLIFAVLVSIRIVMKAAGIDSVGMVKTE